MHTEVTKVATEGSRRLNVVLKLRKYYEVPAVFRLYKAHILPYLERSTPAIFHARPNVLKILDNVQTFFLEAMGVSEKEALINFNLAPLNARRHIGMLGCLHRSQLGKLPNCLSTFFPRARSTMYHYSRGCNPPHDVKIECRVSPFSCIMLRRSVFGLVPVYNKLPAKTVAATFISTFQRLLQTMMKSSASNDAPQWQVMYSPI